MAFSIIFFVISLSVCSYAEQLLPNNYVRCNLSSNLPEFNKCVKTPLTILTSVIINGSSVLDIKSLNPVFIPYLLLESSPNSPINMRLELKNLTFDGFPSLRVVSIQSTNTRKNVIVVEGVIPSSKVVANYTMNGGILRIPIKGSGLVTMDLKNLNLKYEGLSDADINRAFNENFIAMYNEFRPIIDGLFTKIIRNNVVAFNNRVSLDTMFVQ